MIKLNVRVIETKTQKVIDELVLGWNESPETAKQNYCANTGWIPSEIQFVFK